jgi:hypothetical protein
MNNPNEKLYNVLISFFIFIIGVFIGFAARDTMLKVNKKHDSAGYVERHEGQHNFINPLLACDGHNSI